MSRHSLNTVNTEGREVNVLAGFDRPLDGFFLVVSAVGWVPQATDMVRREPRDGDDDTLYCNLDDVQTDERTGQFKSFEQYAPVLERLGVTLPAAMVAAIEEDGAVKRGNLNVNWNAQAAAA